MGSSGPVPRVHGAVFTVCQGSECVLVRERNLGVFLAAFNNLSRTTSQCWPRSGQDYLFGLLNPQVEAETIDPAKSMEMCISGEFQSSGPERSHPAPKTPSLGRMEGMYLFWKGDTGIWKQVAEE